MAVNSITFGGVNSADFGIYISGEGVFNAPKRDVEMIAIPGRDGELALDKGRFENIEVTYPAFNFEPNDYETFAKNLSDFRNAICSLRGYQRLTDTFHPDEYRMAAYIGGLEIKPIKYNTASEFSIIFDCKPQRWLTSGEAAIEVSNGDTLLNSTLFESSPLLMVEGYGTIGFNGYDITLTDDDIGEYDMKVSKQVNIDNGTNYVSVMDGTFPAEIAETGNTIIATSMGISFASALAGNTANNITLGDITLTCTDDSVTYWGRSEKWKRLTNRYHALAEIHVAEATFQLGTVHSFEVSGEVAYSVGSTDRRIHVSITFASDENGHIHVEALAYDHKPSSQSADRRKLKARGVSAPEIQIISTATVLGHPTYVDCDLGEAYRIVEDEYTPLNRYIDLGSDLPKLGVGQNEVTVDDTVTELQIVPRWWRV